MKSIFIAMASLLLVTCAFAAEPPNSVDSIVVDQAVTEPVAEEGCDGRSIDVLTDILGLAPSLSQGPDKTFLSGGCTQACRDACMATRQACVAACDPMDFQCSTDCSCDMYWCHDACGCEQDPPPFPCQ